MTRWEVHGAVCDRLAVAFLGHPANPPPVQPSWEALIAASSHQLVTPALAWALRGTDCPPEVADYFETVLALNRRRNAMLADTLARVVAVLNRRGIEPVLLKGAAQLASGLYPAPGARLIGDIDLLVPTERGEEAAAALGATGFAPAGPAPLVAVAMHHLPRLCERGTGDAVEVHTEVVGERSAPFLPLPWFLAGTRSLPFRGLRLRVPDATRAVAHAIVHDQVQDGGARYEPLRLRPLLDLALLRRDDAAIDWREVRALFDRNGAGDRLAAYLAGAAILFGQPAPREAGTAPAGAVDRLRQALDDPEIARRVRLAALLAAYRARLRAHPRVLLNLVSPRLWPQRIRMLASVLRQSKG